MSSLLTAVITLVSTSGVLTFFLCLYAWFKRREIPGLQTFTVYTLSLSIYIFGYAFLLASESLEGIERWTAVQYIGLAPSAPLGLIFICSYIGKRITKRLVASMMAIPAITVVLVWTNDLHHLYYKSMVLMPNAPFVTVEITIGHWYIVHGVYTFSCMLASVVLLLRRWRETKATYRMQLMTLLLGQLLPMLAAFIYLIGLVPYGIDPVPMVLCVTSALYIGAILSTRLLTVVPIAKTMLFESMLDGVVVLDAADRVTDLNPTLRQLLPGFDERMLGVSWMEALSQLPSASYRAGEGEEPDEIRWTERERNAVYEVRSSEVQGRAGERLGRVLMVIDVTEQRKLQEQLTRMAYYDGLTGVHNRTHFLTLSKKAKERARRLGLPLSFVLFDVDYFKRINDTYGHEAGDRALVHIATVVRSSLAPTMLFGRLGGEEFAIGLPGVTQKEAMDLAEKVRILLEQSPLRLGDQPITLTSSFGVVAFDPVRDEGLESVLRRADEALYQAKRDGRNRVVVFNGVGV